ncbi:MAG: DUF3426 domain-containing protein [Gammaproteobacteria bacterium]|nr:DUF3426 domain-containing protein [Gammaproteobacteria bacterium]
MQVSTIEETNVTPQEAPVQRTSMYTECPSCHTIFRIGPQQLKAANGRVRCGQCGTVFDGLSSLMDELPADVPLAKDEAVGKFTQNDAAALEDFQVSGGRARESISRVSKPAPAVATPPPAEVRSKPSKPSEPKTRPQAAASFATAPTSNYVLDELESPEISTPRGPWLRYALLTSLIVVLALGGVAQYFYFKRSIIAAKYPSVRPYLETACAQISGFVPCDITAPRDLKSMRLTQRDVRSHPNKANALMVTATFVNEASYTQAYPILQLTFSDINGKLIAQRRFMPQEYLTSDIRIEDGMRAGVPMKILLEIMDPGSTAVNFEFSFH